MSPEEWKKIREQNRIRWQQHHEIVGIGKNGQQYYREVDPVNLSTHKWCPDCKQVLPINCFNRSRSTRDGLNRYCKYCQYCRGLEQKSAKEKKKWKENK